MVALGTTDKIFFEETGLDKKETEAILANALQGADDGELYLEYVQSEVLHLNNQIIKEASFDISQGFGMRSVVEDVIGYGNSTDFSKESLLRAAQAVKSSQKGYSGSYDLSPKRTNQKLYMEDNPLHQFDFDKKVSLLKDVDTYIRAKEPSIKQVMCSLTGNWKAVQIIKADGSHYADLRPLIRMSVSVVVEKDNRMESGNFILGGRYDYGRFFLEDNWKSYADQAIDQALINLESVPAPAGEMMVVLGPGWPGILLHEAIGHGLEGDFNRKKTSAFSGLMGQKVASEEVTVVDNGTIKDSRGSLTFDDEGTPSQETVLIENGILKGYMQDRLNARLMKTAPTGNGRRQSFSHAPLPRMTNTYMYGGKHEPEEIISSVKKGLYAANFGGGQVDITSGKFVFTCTEAYKIENGKLGPCVKGATLIGNGPEILTKVSMVGNNPALDNGVGTCGKDGQSVPVGVGQPTLKIDEITVGGTENA